MLRIGEQLRGLERGRERRQEARKSERRFGLEGRDAVRIYFLRKLERRSALWSLRSSLLGAALGVVSPAPTRDVAQGGNC